MRVPCLRGNKPATVFLKVNPMFTKRTSIALACAGIFASIAPSYAQNNSELNPVVVSASRSEQKLSDVISSVSVITKNDIEKTQSNDILSILNSEPGLEISRTGSVGSATSIYLRGGNSNQTLILLDGVPFSGESAAGAISSIEMIPPSQIERIEILRGNASAIYGSGAVGGVINVITKEGSGTPKPNLSLTYGSKNTKNASVGYAGQVEDAKFSISGSKYLTDGFNSINPESFSDVNQSSNGSRNGSLRVNASNHFGAGLVAGINIFSVNTWTSLDGTSSHLDNDSSDRQLRSNTVYLKKNINDQWLTQILYSESDSKSQTYYNQYSMYDSSWNYLGYLTPANSWSNSQDQHQKVSWLNDYEISPSQKINFGYDNQRLKGNSHVSWAGSVDTTRTINSIYSGYSAHYGKLNNQLNLRYDDIQDGESKLTWLVGLGYSLGENWKLTAAKSTAFNAPTGGQLADVSQGGNPNLNAEKSDSYEIGVQYQSANHLMKITYFDTAYQDLIVPGSTFVTPCPFNYCGTYLVNANTASNDGVEIAWRSVGSWGVAKAGLTRQNPMNDATHQMLLNRAKQFGSAEYSKKFSFLEWGAKVSASGYRYTPDAYSGARKRTSGYAIYSTYLSYELEKGLYLKGSIENLFDKNYYQVHGYNAAPQMLFLTLQYQPK